MRGLERNKKPVYLSKRIINNQLISYQTPTLLYVNYMPTNGVGDILVLGEFFPSFLKIKIIDSEDRNKFEAGDRVYVYVTPPEVHDVDCKTADYEVASDPSDSLNVEEIRLKKISGR